MRDFTATIATVRTDSDSGRSSPERRVGRGERVARPALTLATLPRVNARALQRMHTALDEQQQRLNPRERRQVAWWCKHALAMRLLTEAEVGRAMSCAQPFRSLQRLFTRSQARLAKRLNDRILQLANGAKPDERAISIELAASPDDEPLLALTMPQALDFALDSLHRIPAALADLAYQAICLVERTLCPAMRPDEIWNAECHGFGEELRFEYDQLVDADSTAAQCALIEKDGFYHFPSDPEQLVAAMQRAQQMFEQQPPWMHLAESKQPIRQAKALRQKALQYIALHGRTHWIDFVMATCDAITTQWGSDASLRQFRARVSERFVELHDETVPLHYAMLIHTASTCELYNADVHFRSFSDCGEMPATFVDMSKIASSDLHLMLMSIATGLGLLNRAVAANDSINKDTP